VEIRVNAVTRHWPAAGETRIPYWVYTDKDIYQSELERIWYGEHWLYAGLEAEVPAVGSYRTTTLGERSVIVVRSAPDEISVLENRCRHRGVTICQARSGKVPAITCPYHQWTYTLDGSLRGVPFKGGIISQPSKILGCGGAHDRLTLTDSGHLKLAERTIVLDTEMIDNTIIFPF
jgi:phenylpropionate dioxygenase-like ring-hydroxylating dioxygenase large terminal subunit